MPYKLLYTPTPKTMDLAIKIAENVTLLDKKTGFHNNKNFHLDRRVATIHATTAIEGNSLTKEDVQDVINGIPVVGKAQDIKEVKNAYAAYDQIMTYDPYSVKDLLRARLVQNKKNPVVEKTPWLYNQVCNNQNPAEAAGTTKGWTYDSKHVPLCATYFFDRPPALPQGGHGAQN